MSSGAQPPQPWPETYWVEPGRLLAGEYPGARIAGEAARKLGLLLDAGIRTFIDLTEEHELEPYEAVLRELARSRGVEVDYRRMPIRDVSVPDSRRQMSEILTAIEDTLAVDRPAYVHCWGGVGRTGTVIGCHLVQGGLAGEAALGRLKELFAAMGKASWRRSPETAEQEALVRGWTRG